ncbi:MAG: hypothetical protein K5770_08925, partial [Lachnospiraceae bacterium]|nr:hypothetical protein [Lachnospiraceae bacterium]
MNMKEKIRLLIVFIISAFCLAACSVEIETPIGEFECSAPEAEDDKADKGDEPEVTEPEPENPKEEDRQEKESRDSEPETETPVKEEVSIRELCNNEAVDKLFDLTYDELPSEMVHVLLGYAPYSETVTDKTVIAKTIDSLKKVRVKSVPSGIGYNDASGDSYYFELEDGSRADFSFELQYFVWNNDYYEVTEGAFSAPVYVDAYMDDRSFKTRFLNCYNIESDG